MKVLHDFLAIDFFILSRFSGFILMGIFALCVTSRCAFGQEQQVTKHLIDEEDIISAESINAAEEPDLSTSPATVQYRVRPFNNFQQQYQAQQQARLQQMHIHQVREDEQAEASQEAEEEIIQHQQQQQQQAQQQPLFRRQYQPQQQQQQQQQAQSDHPVFRKVEQNQKRFRIRDEVRQQQKQELEDELEEEEPDRLALLLEKSDFQCQGRSAGYFADEGLGCEVFHYCNDNQKHSWICPEGFSFHQVHLICMPAGADNVCQQSSKYHFVNDYLYKALNMVMDRSGCDLVDRF